MQVEQMKDFIREFLETAEPQAVEDVYWLLMEEVTV